MPLILVGRYIPLRLLGKGGFGAAFLARDRYTPAMRQCVVKQFQPSGNLNLQQLKTAQDLFEREAEVLEELGSRHPQIPDLFAFFPLTTPGLQPGKEDQFFYLVQEFIDGQNLEEELETKGRFSETQALEVLREILGVLKFVHEHESIHRDIKPSNIMRDKNGRLYLLDFGAVKQVRTVVAAGAASGRSTGIYSMGFAPPEQMAGSQVYPSTDLYALAVTVITLLTGKDPSELYDSYNNELNWRQYAPQVSNTLADVLDRMLLPTPNQRFQSAQDVLDALASPPTPVPQPLTPPPPPQSAHSSTALGSPNPPLTSSPVSSTRLKRQPFSLLEMLSGAAFTGFEGALLYMALTSLLPSPGISIGLWGMLMGGLIFAQFRRTIEKFDFLIITGITLCLMFFIPALQPGIPLQTAAIVAVLAGAAAIAVTALFRLVYLLLSRLLG
jgi:serine/threonine protein kinase